MSDYDSWLTTPPDERQYCPRCYGSSEEMSADESGYVLFCACGWVGIGSQLLSHDEMVRWAREDGRLDRAGV